MSINIKKKPVNKARRAALVNLLSGGMIIASAGVAGWRQRERFSWDWLPSVNGNTFPCVIWVLDPSKELSRKQGAASNSTIISEWCVKHDVDYRRYRADANMIQVDAHVRALHKYGCDFGAPCLVTCDRKGRAKAHFIPQGTEETLGLLREVFDA